MRVTTSNTITITITIGSGHDGEGAAMKLARAGQRVGVVDAHSQVGGGCTHRGTTPSKALWARADLAAKPPGTL